MKTLVVNDKHELSVREVPMPKYKECQALGHEGVGKVVIKYY